MNEWPTIPLSFIIPFERFNGSMRLFAFFALRIFSILVGYAIPD